MELVAIIWALRKRNASFGAFTYYDSISQELKYIHLFIFNLQVHILHWGTFRSATNMY